MEPPTASDSTEIDLDTKKHIFIVECYWFFRRSCNDVRKHFRQVFGRSAVEPTNKVILTNVRKFTDNGTIMSLRKGHSGRPRSATTPDQVALLEDYMEENPTTSTRRASAELEISKSSVHRIMKKALKLYPYKIQIFQQLCAWDIERRLTFGRRMLRWIQSGKLDPKMIWFSDEAHFWLTGYVNKQNHRFWATENPRIFQTTSMKPERLSVFCAISRSGIIGPFFFEENITGPVYQRMLLEEFIPVAHGLDSAEDWWFMQDGALPHRTLDVFETLDEHFHGRVIGLGYGSHYSGGIDWPPYSPDLNPCDYFLWGYLKDRVYKHRPRTLADLKQAIITEVATVTPDMLANVIDGFERRLLELVNCNGAHFEQYLH